MVAGPSGGGLSLPADLRTAMIAHARAEHPNECCGLVGGPAGGDAREYMPCRNAAASPTAYDLDAQDQLAALNHFDDQDWDLLAIFHSHPHSPAQPSPTDRRLAFYPEAVYLILSLADADAPDLRGFHIQDGQVSEVELA